MIPPDLIDKLKSKKTADTLRGSKIHFSSLQMLDVEPIERTVLAVDQEQITVRLRNYVLLSPHALPLDEAGKKVLDEIRSRRSLDLIEYWSVDPDYDGEVFRSAWQDYRENIDNDNDPLRVVREARFVVPHKQGVRRVAVRAVDVFGWESEVVQVLS